MSLLDIIPAPYRWMVLLAAFAATFAAGGVGGIRFEELVRDARDAKQTQAQLKEQIAATNHTLAEEHRKQDATQEIANGIRKQAEAYQADAAGNRAAGDRLRDQLAAAGHCAGRAQPAAAAGSASADSALSVLADVQRRLADAENATLEFADASRRAGLGCQRIYETVKPQ